MGLINPWAEPKGLKGQKLPAPKRVEGLGFR